MTFPVIAMAALVFLVVIPAGFRPARPYVRNATAAALALQYLFVQAVFIATREPVPTPALWLTDMAVLFVIWSKAPPPGADLTTLGHVWRERNWWDRGVMLCFAPAWYVYAFEGADWWLMYPPAFAQLMLAIGEAIANHRARTARVRADDGPDFPSAGLQFATAGEFRSSA